MSTTTTEAVRRGPRGPRPLYTIDDSNGLIIRNFQGNATQFAVSELRDVWDDLAVEQTIAYLRKGFTLEQISKGEPIPSRIAVEKADKPEKVAKTPKTPKAAKTPSAVVQAVAQVNGTDVGAAAALFSALSKEKKALIRKDPAVVFALAQIKGKVRSLNELIAAPDAPEAVELEQAAD